LHGLYILKDKTKNFLQKQKQIPPLLPP
jgi:hypothetical protein